MPSYVYFRKKIIPLKEAKIGVETNSLHYGTAAFEGIRGNWNAGRKQIYLFRAKEHYERLLRGCRILKIDLPYSVDDMIKITVDMAQKCRFKEDIYIRPLAFKSSETAGVRLHNLDADFLVYAFPWGRYIDADKARVAVSSWRFPKEIPRAKLTGHYITNALAKTEAIENGYDEAIMLNSDGYVAEGSGENLFLVIDGKLVTPGSFDGPLMGITRDTVIKLAKNELGLETTERHIDRVELYQAEECFLTGTAAHITPVAEINRKKVGDGEIGKITKKLQKLYADLILGKKAEYKDWCTPVY
jgi:branched-chain amino acid aminotransferase